MNHIRLGVRVCEGCGTEAGRGTEQRGWRRSTTQALFEHPTWSPSHPLTLLCKSPVLFGPHMVPLIKHPLQLGGLPWETLPVSASKGILALCLAWYPSNLSASDFRLLLSWKRKKILAPWEKEKHKHILSTRDGCVWVPPELPCSINYTILGYTISSSMRELYFLHYCDFDLNLFKIRNLALLG